MTDKRQELDDRLTDLALDEVAGGASPPDLSEEILAAAHSPGKPQRRSLAWWLSLAASLLFSLGIGAFLAANTDLGQWLAIAQSNQPLALVGGSDSRSQESHFGQAESQWHSVEQPEPTLATGPEVFEDDLRHVAPYGTEAINHGPMTEVLDQQVTASSNLSSNSSLSSLPTSHQSNFDVDFEQRRRPAGSLQVELYNGRTTSPANKPYSFDSEVPVRPIQVGVPTGTNPNFVVGAGINSDAGVVGTIVLEEQPPAVAGPGPGRLEAENGEGRGAGQGGDRYRPIVENRFLGVGNHPLSTFSIDVDTASYAKSRRLLMQSRMLPPPDAVRIEEFINYFSYDYAPPKDDKPFSVHLEVASCPWQAKHRLVRIGLKGKEIEQDKRPASNLVFLVDVSGSMESPDKLPLVQRGLRSLVENLGENDRVAIVVYASATGLVLPSTRGDQQAVILDALDRLQAGGSTNGGEGIRLAYGVAAEHFISGGTNRVILCTDGDFNVGTTSDGELVRLVKEKAKDGVFLSVLGFGIGNHNDSMLEQVADNGNGNYAYVDTISEAHKVFVEEMGGTLVTIAKDVKIQVEFNPAQVEAYRLIGYENRMLRTEDFKDDAKDAGEIGAGHSVTALYEVVPSGEKVPAAQTEELKYQRPSSLTKAAEDGELLTVKLRYKLPEENTSQPLEKSLKDAGTQFDAASEDFQFAASVASFGMLLRGSQYAGDSNFQAVGEIAAGSIGKDSYRTEFVDLVNRARELSGQK